MKLFDYNVEVMDTSFKKFRGLMFRKKCDTVLIFPLDHESRLEASIHSFFCPRFDVAFVDKQKKIVDLRENVRPWVPNITPKKASSFVVEMPPGTVKKQKLSIGKKLDFTT